MGKLAKMSRLSGLFGLFGFGGRGKGGTQQQRRTLSIQPLEERTLLSVCHWTGNGANSLWSNSANWDTAPLSGRGDTLIFQGTQRTSTSNDLAAGSSFASIEFAANNFSLGGNSLILTSGVSVDSGVTGSAISLNTTLSGDVTFNLASSTSTLALSGVLSGSSSTFYETGSGTIMLSGVGSSLLSFRVYSGTATFTSSGSLSTGNTIASGGTINWNSSGNCYAGRVYVGWGTSGTFTQTAGNVGAGGSTPGDIEMDTAGTYNLSGGVLAVSAIDAYTNGVVPSGNTLNFGGGTLRTSAQFNYATISGMTYNVASGTTSTIDTQGYNLTLASAFNGSGNLTKAGSGTLTLSATSSSYTGTTRIGGGTLTLANSSALQNSTIDLNSADSGSLSFGSLTSATIGGLMGSRNLSLQNASSQAVDLTSGNNNVNTSYAGVLSGSNSTFFKVGTGTMTLTGVGSSLLGFRVKGGTATFAGASSLSTGNTIANGGTINWNSSGNCYAGRLYVGWFSAGTFTQTAGNVGAGGASPGDLDMEVSGTYNLNGGVLALSAIDSYESGVVPSGNTFNFGGGTLRITTQYTYATISGMTYNVASGTTSTIDTQGYNLTLASAFNGSGSLTKTGSGTLTLSGDNTCYSGTTTISNGVLKLGSATAVGSNSSVAIPNADNAYLDLNGQTIGSTVSLSAGNYTTGQSAIQNSSTTAATFAGPISLLGVGIYAGAGNGQITLSGNITDGGMNRYLCNGLATSTLVLSGSNNFGRLAVWGTRIRLNSGSALASTTQVDFRYNSTLEVNGYFNITVGKFFSQSGSTGTVLLNINSGSLTVGDNSDQTFAGTISGAGSFVKQGTGMLTLSGTLSHTGQTTAAGGTLNLLAKPTSWTENGGAVIGPGALNFLDTATYQSVCGCFGDGVLDRNNMISILTTAESGNTVTQNELTDLRTIVSNPSRLRMTGYVSATNPGYVDVLASDVVNSNAANAHYQGATLGNLAANDSGTKLETLINKWFRGTDHPAVTDASYTYQQATGSLFDNGPSVGDMDQSTVLGDCYLIGSLGAIAERSTDAIQNMFVYNNDNTWTVRFYADGVSTTTADYVTVDRMLPANSSSLLVYANHGLGLSSELWMPLAEKAYAQWNETGNAYRPTTPTNLNGYNTYAAIEGGNSGVATGQVLGVLATGYYVNGAQSILNNALASGLAVTINTYDSGTTDLTADHTYVVSSYNSGTGYYTLHNPWGPSYDPVLLTWSQLVHDCQWFAYDSASGTSPFNLPATHSSSSEVIDTLVNSGLAADSSLGSDVAQAWHANVLNTMKSSASVKEPLVSVRAQSAASVLTCASGQSHAASVVPRSSMAKAIDEVMASGGIFDDEQLWKLH